MTRPLVLHVAAVEFTASRLLRPQLQHLQNSGYNTRVACAPDGDKFSADLRDFRPIPLEFPRSIAPVAMALTALRLRRIVANLRPAIVHFHTPAASIPGRAILAINPNRPRIVYTAHGYLHTWDRDTPRQRMLQLMEHLLSRWTDVTLLQSREDYERASEAGFRGRLVHLGNGVGDEWFEEWTSPAIQGPLHIVFVGRLAREKGLRELLGAVRQLSNVRLTIVGDALTSDRDPLVVQARREAAMSNGRVRVTGLVTPDAVRGFLQAADIFVLPSWREGVPRSVIEAMATGLPTIATDIRGCRELVVPGVTGWLIPRRNQPALVEALKHASGLPRDRIKAMGAAARSRAWSEFREIRILEKIVQEYCALGFKP